MRRLAILGVAAASAVLGGTAGVVVDNAWENDRTSTVILRPEPAGVPTPTIATAGVRPSGVFDAAALYATRSPGVVTIHAEIGRSGSVQGSGFVVDRQGTILTNSHVITDSGGEPAAVEGAARLYVEFDDGERVEAKIVGWDLFNDVGVVKVDPTAHALVPVPLGDSDSVRVGEPIAAIGSPFGQQGSLAVGVISATRRTIDSLTSGFAVADAIQIDAPINRGNSGGPLFDSQGRVIGINTQIQSASGTAEGVGFAVPINSAKRSLRQLLRDGTVRYAYLGIETQTLTPGLAAQLGVVVSTGAIVVGVREGTPAARAGLRAATSQRVINGLRVGVGGDIIVAIAGRAVRSSDDVSRIVAGSLTPNQNVKVAVVREGKRTTLSVTLGTRPRDPRR